jgi:hypothetical protein
VLLIDAVVECTLEAVVRRIEQIGTGESWEVLPMADILHVENAQLGLKSKIFMTVLRHALTGMKVRLVFLSFCYMLTIHEMPFACFTEWARRARDHANVGQAANSNSPEDCSSSNIDSLSRNLLH